MNTNEHLKRIEHEPRQSNEDGSSSTHLEIAQVELVFVRRVEMLSSVEQALPKSLYVKIAEKILHEREKLIEFIQIDATTAEKKKKSMKVLDQNFFVQKSLDIHII